MPRDAGARFDARPAQKAAPLTMITNAVSVMAGKLATMALGFLFWLIAARMFDPAQVGLAAAVVSGMMLCTQLALLGVGSAVIHDFPDHVRRPAALLNPAISLICLSGLVTGAGFVAVVTVSGGELSVVGTDPVYLSLFLATSVLGTLGILFDQTSIALRRGDQVLSRGLLFGGVAIVALALLSGVGGQDASVAIFSPWLFAGAAAFLMAWVQLRRSIADYRLRAALPRPVVRRLVRIGLPNWALTLTERAPGLILPIVVTELLSPETNATWYAVWMMAWVIYVVPISIGLTLFAEARHRPDELENAVDQGVRAALLIGVAAAAVLALAAPLALTLLGHHYAASGTTPLRILVWAVIPMVFVQAYFASCRAAGRLGEAIATGTVSGVVSIAAAGAAGPSFGLDGMAIAWVACQSVTGLWAYYRVRRAAAPVADADAPEQAGRGLVSGPGTAARAARGPLSAHLPQALLLLALAAALAIWFLALTSTDVRAFDDLGLISALPAASYVALAILSAGFAVSLRAADTRWWMPAAYLVGLIVMIDGLRPMIESESAFRVTWRHVGVTEVILRSGSIDSSIDAYFNWPGFFVLAALLVRLAGLDDALAFTQWFQLVFNLALIGPLFMVYRTATRDRRVVWLALWIFYVTNWVGQDYFAPQALALFLHVAMIGIILQWFSQPRPERPPGGRRLLPAMPHALAGALQRFGPERGLADLDQPEPAVSTPVRRAALMGVVVLLFSVIVATHQLTPFAGILGVGALVLAGICTARRLPLLMIVILGSWLGFLAVSYLSGHLSKVTGQVGDVSTTVGTSVGGRIVGSSDHLLVLNVRLLLTALIWAVAAVGAVRAWRAGRRLMAYILLAATPLPLLAGQSYGGEIVLRVYLFGLPFVALLAAFAAFPRSDRGRSWIVTAAVAVAGFLLVCGFLVTRYGNERMDYFSTGEVTAVHQMYDVAPQGSLLVAGSGNLPWKFRNYDSYDYKLAVDLDSWLEPPAGTRTAAVLREIVGQMRSRGEQGAFFIITRSQKAEAGLTGLGPPGAMDRLEAAAAASPDLKVLVSNPDATVFVLRGYRPTVTP